jgi:hypothetical protein
MLSRAASREADEDHSADTRLPAQKIDALFDIQGDVLEIDDRLVVVRARVHAEHHEATLGELLCADHIHKVRRAMDGQEGHRRSRSTIGRIKGAFSC